MVHLSKESDRDASCKLCSTAILYGSSAYVVGFTLSQCMF